MNSGHFWAAMCGVLLAATMPWLIGLICILFDCLLALAALYVIGYVVLFGISKR